MPDIVETEKKTSSLKKALARNQWKIIFSVEIILCIFAAVILCVRNPYTYSVKADDIISCDYNTYVKYINHETEGLLSVAMETFEFPVGGEELACQKIAFVELSLPFGAYRISVETEGSCNHQIEMIPFAKNNEDLYWAEDMVLKQNAEQSDYVVKLPVIDLGEYGYEFFMNSVLGETTIRQIVIEECTVWKGIAIVLFLVFFLIIDILFFCVENRQKTIAFLTDNQILPIIYTVCGYCATLSLLIFKWDSIVDSDMSSELILGKRLSTSAFGILDSGWFYSTELRVLNTQLIYKFFFWLCGDNWHLVRVCSVAVFMLLMIGAALYFLKMAGIRRSTAVWIAGTLVWPFGNLYALIALYGSYYVPHIVINFLILGLLLHFCRLKEKNGKYSMVPLFFLCLLSFASGLGGVRQIMLSYVPLFMTGVILYLLNSKGSEETRKLYHFLIADFLAFVCALMGYGVNHIYYQKAYSYEKLSASVWQNFTVGDVLESISNLFRLTGYQEDVDIISLPGMVNLLVILFVISFVVALIRLLTKVNNVSFSMKAVIVYICTAIALQTIIFAANKDYNATHWMPMVPFVFVILGMAYETEAGIQKETKRRVFWKSTFILTVVLSSLFVWATPRICDVNGDFYYQNQGMYDVAQWLTSQKYTKGIASFWGSNVLTEYSDGAIEMWTIDPSSLEIYEWLQAKEHAENLPDGKVFMLFTEKEIDESKAAKSISETYADCLIYADRDYYIYGFEDIDSYGIFE